MSDKDKVVTNDSCALGTVGEVGYTGKDFICDFVTEQYIILADAFREQRVPLRKVVNAHFDDIASYGSSYPMIFAIMVLMINKRYEQRVIVSKPDGLSLSNPDIIGAALVNEDWDERRLCDEVAADIEQRKKDHGK